MRRYPRIDCMTCGRDVAVRWVNKARYVGVYPHVMPTGGWCGAAPFRDDGEEFPYGLPVRGWAP